MIFYIIHYVLTENNTHNPDISEKTWDFLGITRKKYKVIFSVIFHYCSFLSLEYLGILQKIQKKV